MRVSLSHIFLCLSLSCNLLYYPPFFILLLSFLVLLWYARSKNRQVQLDRVVSRETITFFEGKTDSIEEESKVKKKSESQAISSSVTGSLSKISVRRRRWRTLPVILDCNWKSCFLRDKLVASSFLLFTRTLRNLNRYLRILEKNLYINYNINYDFRKGWSYFP